MPARIALVRHGQTEWNRVERFRGRADINLNDVGLKQAEATAARLAGLGLAAIYSSPMQRALRTAQAAARRAGLEVGVLPGVIDVDYGHWQGLTVEEARLRDPDVFAQWQEDPGRMRFPGGESMEEVRARASAAVEAVTARHADQSIAVVSHVTVCRLLVLHLLDLDTSHFWRIALDNCSLSLFEMRDGLPVALRVNDTCHLHGRAA